jgi:hypothetical protein
MSFTFKCPDNGLCEGIEGTDGCCFECGWYAECPVEIKCDQPELYRKGICQSEAQTD